MKQDGKFDWMAYAIKLEGEKRELVGAMKKLIMHRNQGNLHPIDYQRVEKVLAKLEED